MYKNPEMKNLPADYVEYISAHGETEGPIAIEPGWCVLWPFEKLVEYNNAYQVAIDAPSYYAFGSNGAGEMLAFSPTGNVVMIPFVGMLDEEAIVIAETWSDFEREVRKSRKD
jgi:hypothetical protein